MIDIPHPKPSTGKVIVISKDSIQGEIEINGTHRKYTQLMVHTGGKVEPVEPFSVFLLDAALRFDDATTLILHSDESGRPIWLKDMDGTLVWQQPKNVSPWVAVYHDHFLQFDGPYDRIGADVVVVSYVRGDGYFFVRTPKQYVDVIRRIYPKLKVETGGAPHSMFREYVLLFQTLGEDPRWQNIVEPLLAAIPAAVLLPDWPYAESAS